MTELEDWKARALKAERLLKAATVRLSDYNQTIQAAEAEISRLSASRGEVDGWRPIETAPKDGTPVLAAHTRAVFSAWWGEDECGWVDGTTNSYEELVTFEPTHWRPLPDPPAILSLPPLDEGKGKEAALVSTDMSAPSAPSASSEGL